MLVALAVAASARPFNKTSIVTPAYLTAKFNATKVREDRVLFVCVAKQQSSRKPADTPSPIHPPFPPHTIRQNTLPPLNKTASTVVYQKLKAEVATLKNQTLAALATPAGKANATAIVDAFQAKVNASVLAHASVMDSLAAAKPNKTAQFAALAAAVNKTAGVESLAAKVNTTSAAWAKKVAAANKTLTSAVATKNATLNSAIARKNATLYSALATKNATLAGLTGTKDLTALKTAFGGVSFLQNTDEQPAPAGEEEAAEDEAASDEEAADDESDEEASTDSKAAVDFLVALPKDVVAEWTPAQSKKLADALATFAKVETPAVTVKAVSPDAGAVDASVDFADADAAKSFAEALKAGDAGLSAATAVAGLGSATASDVKVTEAAVAGGADGAATTSGAKKLSGGAIAGITIGSLAGVALIAAGALAFMAKKR